MKNRLVHSVSVAALTLMLSGGAFAATKETAGDPTPTAPPATTEDATPAQPSDAASPKPAAAEQAAPAVPAEDVAVAEKLRDLIENKLKQHVAREQDRAGVLAFYQNRAFAPLWIGRNAALPRAKGAVAYLRGVGADGLDPADYPTPGFADLGPERLAADELKLTSSLLTFARHASTGRVAFTRASGAVYFDQKFPSAEDTLSKLAATDNIGAALDAFNPQHSAYKALKAALAAAEKQSGAGRSGRTDAIIANMERWRWMPHDLGAAYVVVNVPDYTLKVVNQGATAWSTRIVVGKPGSHATPLLTETMKYITVNPTWNVPPSIIRNEYLPALAQDPGALTRVGLRVGRNSDGSIRIYQPPGERNALGRIRFNFPNRFLVYQHDTPNKDLFAKATRAYSHGCMRVQNPDQYAEVLLSISQPEEHYTAKRIRALYGSGERGITFKTPIPVYVTYQTAFVDDAGKLQTRPDIYGLDKTITTLLHEDRRVADVPIARNYSSGSKPVMGGRLPRSAHNEEFARSSSYGWGAAPAPTYDRFRTW